MSKLSLMVLGAFLGSIILVIVSAAIGNPAKALGFLAYALAMLVILAGLWSA